MDLFLPHFLGSITPGDESTVMGYRQKEAISNWAYNSVVECHLHTVEVVGSNPTAPIIHPIIKFKRVHCRARNATGCSHFRPCLWRVLTGILAGEMIGFSGALML